MIQEPKKGIFYLLQQMQRCNVSKWSWDSRLSATLKQCCGRVSEEELLGNYKKKTSRKLTLANLLSAFPAIIAHR